MKEGGSADYEYPAVFPFVRVVARQYDLVEVGGEIKFLHRAMIQQAYQEVEYADIVVV